MDYRAYIKNDDPSIEVCIHYGQYGCEQKTTHSITVKMCGVIKDMNPDGVGWVSAPLWYHLQACINGRETVTEHTYKWISKLFWKNPECWVTTWDLFECPYFN
jgi:hypothetical protein